MIRFRRGSSSEMKPFDILIVGAGIVGSAVARECALIGWRVGVIEGGTPAGGATAAGMGHVVVMDDSPAQFALTAFSRSLWQRDSGMLPKSVEYENRGTIWVAADDEEMAEVHARQKAYEEAGIEAQVLTAAELADKEPNLRSGLTGGLLVPGDSVVYPPAAAGFYLAEARRLGAEVFLARAMSASQGQVLLSDGVSLVAERIVLAVGTECDLLPSLPIQKRKGHLVITDRYPGFLHHQLVELGYLKSAHKVTRDSVAFNIQPRQTGQLLLGSSRQYSNEGPEVEAEILRRMIDRASEYMPGLEKLSVLRVWTGFRAATADKLPLIGSAAGLSEDRSLWLAAGFEGLGITNAPGAARLLIDGMLGRASAIDAGPYLPARLMEPARLAHV
jgi:glycine/D-amino acid oxidase-like deaminating enzyme